MDEIDRQTIERLLLFVEKRERCDYTSAQKSIKQLT